MSRPSDTSHQLSLARGSGLLRRAQKKKAPERPGAAAAQFLDANRRKPVRVFVAGGHRSGNKKIYEREAFNLGRTIGAQQYRLDFGLSSHGIMGAVARGVLHEWARSRPSGRLPIQGVTTREYLALYQSDKVLKEVSDIIVARTLEERKNQLLAADFVIFAPGGVGTLDELVYDCLAMQDGFLNWKPFVLFNVAGFFHHLVEFLKDIRLKGFADPIPFIVVDDCAEAEIAFRLIDTYYRKKLSRDEALRRVEKIIYELPYVILQKRASPDKSVAAILAEKDAALAAASPQARRLRRQIERAYLDKEIGRMYSRLAKSGQDTALISQKLSSLKRRSGKSI